MNNIINLIINNKLYKLSLKYCSFENIDQFNVLSNALLVNNSLHKLLLSNNNLNKYIINIIENNKFIDYIDLSNTQIDNNIFKVICNKLKCMKYIDLSNNYNLNNIEPIYDLLANNNTLTYLKLHFTNITNFNPLINGLKLNNTLKTLIINSNSFDYESLINLLDLIKQNKSITNLNISNIYFSSIIGNIEFIKNLCEILKYNNTITNIDISYNNINNGGYNSLINLIKNNNTIKYINMYSSNSDFMSQRQFNDFNKALIKNNTLEYINIIGCINNKIDLNPLYESLQINNTIKTFGIDYDIIQNDDKINKLTHKIHFICDY